MEIQEREAFNFQLISWCIGRSGWDFNNHLAHEVSNNIDECFRKSLAAEQVFRAEVMRRRPGVPIKLGELVEEE